MSKRIYVGNLPAKASESKISKLFGSFGKVSSIEMIADPAATNSCYLEMEGEEATKAIETLNGSEFEGQRIQVWEKILKEPKKPKPQP